MRVELEDVQISGHEVGVAPEPLERFTISFAEIVFRKAATAAPVGPDQIKLKAEALHAKARTMATRS
jgi:hypothetical protein